MSDLTPSFITLDQGLNLHVPKIAAPPGTILNMLNYEQVDFQGQKRIDGYVRYDGSLGSYQDQLFLVTLTGGFFNGTESLVFSIGELVGVVVDAQVDEILLAVINHNLIPENGDVLTIEGNDQEVVSCVPYESTTTPAEQYDGILDSNAVLRERTTELSGPVAGLHWFNDRLYAVASVIRVDMTGEVLPQLNDTYMGQLVLKVDAPYIYVGAPIVVGTLVGSDMASLYQSRTEQQALDELGNANQFGWEFVHQGWVVPFEEGVSLYGSLTALNQNRKGVGVQGPTSIDGNNGKPLSLTQKAEITNMPVQVNGWKTSDSRTTYNLDVHALDNVDNWSIYADAYLSWDGETGVVSTVGIHSEALIEYSPTATVEVDV